jgi:hypothetical protein
VGERIAAANARIEVDHVTAVLGDKRITVQRPNMAQLLAD